MLQSLYPHQEKGIKFLIMEEQALLADSMGLGKSAQAIMAIKRLGIRAIVFCPKSVIKQWVKEIHLWAPQLKVAIPNGKDRAITYKTTDADIILVNYEKVWRSIEDKYLYRLNYDCIVLDEAQRIKNRKSKQARAIKALPNVKYKWCLTGTPMENRVSELISILEFLGHWPEGRRYKGNCWDDRELLDEILWGSMLRRQFDDFDYMPPAIVNNYYIELHPYQKELYNRFLNDLIVYIRDKVFSVIHALARMVRLRQVANSVQLLDKRRSESNKLRELLILMHERVDLGEKVVVFSEFKRMCYIIKAALEKRGFSVAFIRGDPKCDVEEEKTKFENECQVMLCTKSGETGLNLQVAHNIINFELPYNPARVLQRIGRCRRIGQTKPVNVINFLGLDTIDERILEILYEKRKVFSRIIEPHSIGVQMSRALIRELVGV